MAEGWARHLKGNIIEPYSAGIVAHGLNPRAVRVMKEAGVDISKHTSDEVESMMGVPFDYVVTVCGHADKHCPIFPSKAKVIHIGFDDPPSLATSAESEDEVLSHFRRVRDEIRAFIEALPESLSTQTGAR
jgi:arsenate reductase